MALENRFKIRLLLYRLYATIRSVVSYLRGESSLQASYEINSNKRIRRSLGAGALSESIVYGGDSFQKARYNGTLLVYSATIGEFHPLVPVINAYLEKHPEVVLVIFVAQLQYCDAMHKAYPHAIIGVLPPIAPWLYDKLFEHLNPRIVALGVGPSLYLRFPIPFELALPATCLKYEIPLVVVNSALFEFVAHSRAARFEHRVFGSLHMRAIQYWYTQNDLFKSGLIKDGIPSERVIVTGDLIFDHHRPLATVSEELGGILEYIGQNDAPVIVAGSVNAIDEEAAVIDGWTNVCKQHPEARLIVAPRHINNTESMNKLYEYLRTKEIQFAKRSDGAASVKGASVIVVDVFGELPHYYSIATLAYIGRNHGVLEPLRFKVPTVVAPLVDWNSDYPTYPLCREMIDAGGIIEVEDKKNLGELFLQIVNNPDFGQQFVANALRFAETQRGAGKKIVAHWDTFLQNAR